MSIKFANNCKTKAGKDIEAQLGDIKYVNKIFWQVGQAREIRLAISY